MTHILLLFLDGIGIGSQNPVVNPFVRASLPNLLALLEGMLLTTEGVGNEFHGGNASLLALDAHMGVEGLPQSATGQATLFTGINIPAAIGLHDGPKPTPAIAIHLNNGNIFSTLRTHGKSSVLLNAYPPRYFRAIQSGHRLPGAIAMAAFQAGLSLKTKDDLVSGQALSADFTAQGWRDHLGISGIPVLTSTQAGERLAALAMDAHFAVFEYWLSDVAGHRQDMNAACELLEQFDQVLGSLVQAWDRRNGLVLLTSDHGNLEDLSTRRHTDNPVPLLIIGDRSQRDTFTGFIRASQAGDNPLDLTCLAPAILQFIFDSNDS